MSGNFLIADCADSLVYNNFYAFWAIVEVVAWHTQVSSWKRHAHRTHQLVVTCSCYQRLFELIQFVVEQLLKRLHCYNRLVLTVSLPHQHKGSCEGPIIHSSDSVFARSKKTSLRPFADLDESSRHQTSMLRSEIYVGVSGVGEAAHTVPLAPQFPSHSYNRSFDISLHIALL